MQQLALGRVYRVQFASPFHAHGYQTGQVETPTEITLTEVNQSTYVDKGYYVVDGDDSIVALTTKNAKDYLNKTFKVAKKSVYLHRGRGLVTLEAIMSMKDAMISGVSLYASFFEPCGITVEQYNGHRTSTATSATPNPLAYSEHPIYKFVDIEDTNDVFYVPELAIASFPEVTLEECLTCALNVDLGTVAARDLQRVDAITTAVKNIITMYGIDPSGTNMFVYGRKFLSAQEYDDIAADRHPVAATTITLSSANEATYVGKGYYVIAPNGDATLLTTSNKATYMDKQIVVCSNSVPMTKNYYTETLELRKRVAELQAKNEALQDLVVKLNQ